MISSSDRDNSERAAPASLPAALGERRRPATTRSVEIINLVFKRLIRTVLCALALSTGAHGLAWEATIERDALGVPHIFGETDADMAFGLAWAQSEDGWEILEESPTTAAMPPVSLGAMPPLPTIWFSGSVSGR